MTTATYAVTGMTCEHCVNAVTSELGGLSGVSAVTVASDRPLPADAISGALDEAGGYQVASM